MTINGIRRYVANRVGDFAYFLLPQEDRIQNDFVYNLGIEHFNALSRTGPVFLAQQYLAERNRRMGIHT